MRAHPLIRASLLLLGALWLACAPDDRKSPLAPPSFSEVADPVVTSLVFGPDGSTICNSLPDGAVVMGRLINPNPPDFVGQDGFACPENTLAMSGPPGSWLMRVQLPGVPGIGSLPWRHLETDPVVFSDADLRRDVQVLNGTALGGSATIDGNPVEGVGLGIVYDQAPAFGATSGASGPDGHWAEFFRSPFILQNGVRYRATPCGALGVQFLEGAPAGGFLFPSEVNAISCTMTTAPAAQFSHTITRLVVTPMPGDIGGQSAELTDRYGVGWGVQFPVRAGQPPVHVPPDASHIFLGGLMIGIAPGRVLTGTSVEGEMQCAAACRDFGLDGVVSFTDPTPAGRKVMWRYSDATSPEGVGLRVVQRSFDGVLPNDYVLFQFSIQNLGASTETLYAGFWADWDVDVDPFDDVGFTEMGGRLMYETSSDPDDAGTYIGTLLRGDAPISGNFVFRGAVFPDTIEQVQALSGVLRRETDGPGDLRYIHGIGPITLARGRKADLWIAIVAGENHDQLVVNALAADADIGRRRLHVGDFTDASRTVNTQPLGVPGRPFSKTRPQ